MSKETVTSETQNTQGSDLSRCYISQALFAAACVLPFLWSDYRLKFFEIPFQPETWNPAIRKWFYMHAIASVGAMAWLTIKMTPKLRCRFRLHEWTDRVSQGTNFFCPKSPLLHIQECPDCGKARRLGHTLHGTNVYQYDSMEKLIKGESIEEG